MQTTKPGVKFTAPGTRPSTSGSVALSSVGSLSVASINTNNSATPSQLDALIQRRTALRSQMAIVEQQLAQCPPSTPSVASTQRSLLRSNGTTPRNSLAGFNLAPAIQAAEGALPMTLAPIPPRDSRFGGSVSLATRTGGEAPKVQSSRTPAPPPAMISGGEDRLPGAMRPGRYAFWPKRLPGAAAASRRGNSASGLTRGVGSGGGGVVAFSSIGGASIGDRRAQGQRLPR